VSCLVIDDACSNGELSIQCACRSQL
jgi:hypothetical protein